MEGVVVIAQAKGSNILTSVTSNAHGQFRFLRDRLDTGQYTITVRAGGYKLSGEDAKQTTSITDDKTSNLNLALLTVSNPSELATQLTTLDWVQSAPGTDEQKDLLVRNMVNCGFCHTMERVMRSTHDAESFLNVIQRMHTYETDHSSADLIRVARPPQALENMVWYGRQGKDIANYLATLNLSGGKETWDFPFTFLPRPSGEGTNAVVTVFPIPRQPSVIHDLDVDSKGNVWYGNTGWDFIGKLDPSTGNFDEWLAPNYLPAPARGSVKLVGVQDIQVDTEDNIWVAVGGNKHAAFNPETEQWRSFDLPVIWKNPFLGPIRTESDALWATAITTPPEGDKLHEHAFRLNIHTGELSEGINLFDDLPAPTSPGRVGQLNYCYMMDQDSNGNFLCTVPEASAIARTDSQGNVRMIPTPTPYSYPRRGYRDEQERFWFSEFFADKVAFIDLKTDKITEYPVGPKYIAPYYARPDRTGKIWVSSTGSDLMMRLDPKTGKVVKYLMPVNYDARKVVVDNRADRITVWLPNKNRSELIRIEVDD